MGSKKVAKERRSKLKLLVMKSYHTQEELAAALKTSTKTIERDLEKIKVELEEQAGKGEFNEVLSDFLAKITGSYNNVATIIAGTSDDRVKIKGEELLNALRESRIKIMQSLGIVRELAPMERKAVVVRFVKPEWMRNGNTSTAADAGSGSTNELPAVCDTGEVSQESKEV